MTNIHKLHWAYYDLTNFGGWNRVDANDNYVTILKPETSLFHCEKEIWIKQQPLWMKIYKDGTYELNGGSLSLYDREVVEGLGLTKKDKQLKS